MELPHERLFPWPTDEETLEDQNTRSKRIDILRTSIRQKVLLKQAKMKARVDKHRRKPKEYSPGDLIIVARNIRKIGRTKKLLPKRHQGKKKEESMATVSSTRQPDKTVQNTQRCGVRNSTARPASGRNNSRNKNKKWPSSQTSGSMASAVEMDGRKQKQFQSTTKLPFSSLSEDHVIFLSHTLYLLFRTFASKSPSRMAEMLRVKFGLNSDYSNDSQFQVKTKQLPPFRVDLGHKV
ncbi:hypothetical protein DAPPUDRAFT_112642 [Daphnia pulex]|uniref:Uncharacterized protein n=1 Tax=Daphnia pulex TaxID=6669 RepID=E9HCH3_DAPPU|nr:hypothetical protein DAPPUDRAFT_112642 [Daphnia pulex]|eukprot:EFX70534.1 hypothetical protein DAPPUDRAFT_112642 [Daphnia pulex]